MFTKDNNVILNFALEFNQTFFYSYFIQIIIITYLYNTIGSGRYWKVLLYGSILGFFGALMEHSFIAWQNTLSEDEKGKSYSSLLLLVAEIGWISTEFAVPILNLIKLNSLSHIKVVKTVNTVTWILFGIFGFFRVEIGYNRFLERTVSCEKCTTLHSKAFGVMAVTDIILSAMIFVRINKSSREYRIKKNNENISILTTFKKSSVFSLLIVDVISVFLSLTYISPSTQAYAQPFHALKSNFLLVLAVDAFVFKFKAHTSGGSTYKSYNNENPSNTNMCQSSSNLNTIVSPNKSVFNSNLGNNPSNISIVVHSNSNFNLSSSQPIITNNYNKTFGLFKNELLNNRDEDEFGVETPKPAANSSSYKLSNSPFLGSPSNRCVDNDADTLNGGSNLKYNFSNYSNGFIPTDNN